MKPENVNKRIHPCLVSTISEYLEGVGLPACFGPAVAFTLIQSVIGKRYYFRTRRGPVFMSAFRFMIGAPGMGKSMASDLVDKTIKEAEIAVPIAPSSVTKASMVDYLADVQKSRRTWGVDANEIMHTLLINASEYGVYIGNQPGDDFYRGHCELFDCRTYTETRRSNKGDVLTIPNPYINMLAGTQPEHFAEHFPREAFKAGFASRCDFTYSEEVNFDPEYYLDYTPNEDELTENEVVKMARSLAHDIQCIVATCEGEPAQQMYLTNEAAELFIDWCNKERPDTDFTHPWLLDYNSRRIFRLRRDCAMWCLARGDTKYNEIELVDVENAIAQHRYQDQSLAQLTDKVMTSEKGDIIKMTHNWGLRVWIDTKKPIPRGMVTEFLLNHLKPHEVQHILKHLIEHEVFFEVGKGPSHTPGVDQIYSVKPLTPNPKWRPGI